MARLLVHVEGQTEEQFVNRILRDHLISWGYHSVDARILGNSRLRQNRGGIRPWPSAKRDILNHLQQDHTCIATTMVDYYGLPQSGSGAWPGRYEAAGLHSTQEKATCVEDSVAMEIRVAMGNSFDPRRFIPCVVMHEFEALLFSDCAAFSRAIGHLELGGLFQAIRQAFATPEEINDSPHTAPSKRIQALVPGYQKPVDGILAAQEIALPKIRLQCPHFGAWIARLESGAQLSVSAMNIFLDTIFIVAIMAVWTPPSFFLCRR